MKLVHTAEIDLGVVRNGEVVDVTSVFDDIKYRSSLDRIPKMLGELSGRKDEVASLVASASGGPSLDDLKVLAPVPRPPKLIACLRNYFEGVERERETQDMFLESPDSVIGTGGTVTLPDHDADIFHHEAELAVVIGKRSRNLAADESALDAIAGYTMAIDVSGRGIGRMGPSRMGKSFSTFTPLGPMILTTDEVEDPQNLLVELSVNGQPRQSYSTSDMEYSVVEVLAFASSYMTLVPGDVLMLGTNHQGLGPMQDGDEVVMTIDGFGSLEVSVTDPLKRSWPAGIDEAVAARTRGDAA